MLLYYITDSRQFPGPEAERRERLLAKIAEAARCGVDFIQLRERDLTARELEMLARQAAQIVREANAARRIELGKRETGNGKRPSRLLINSRTDVALAAGADGVHLRSDDISAAEARAIWAKATGSKVITDFHGLSQAPGTWGTTEIGNEERETGNGIFAVSCHTAGEVRMAEAQGADFAVFGPVFEKVMAPQRAGVGLYALGAACSASRTPANLEGVGASHMPVLALGGITVENASACIKAGAAGIAGIRIFQEDDIAGVVHALRGYGKSRDGA
jgi:thiamine-phosphate pyrophosphorylase